MDVVLPLLVGSFLAAVVGIVVWAAWKPLLLVAAEPPPLVLRDIAYRLRVLGYAPDAAQSPIRIELDSLSALKVHVRAGPRGTEVRYEVEGTTAGWALVLILMFTGYLGLVAVGVAIFIHASASGFARKRLLPTLQYPVLGTLPRADARSLLIEGLSEAQRFASEARAWEREANQNAVALIILGSLVLWVVALLALPALAPPIGLSLALDIGIATAASGTAAVLGSWAVLRRSRPLLRELERDAGMYRAALANEILGAPTPKETRGGLELLLYAAERSPRWREIRRRRRTWHDPWMGFTVFAFAEVTLLGFAFAVLADFLPVEARIGLAVVGALSVLGGFQTVASERRRVREQDERDRREWERRRQEIETTFWEILSG